MFQPHHFFAPELIKLLLESWSDGGLPQRGHSEVHSSADAEEQHQAGG